MNLFLSCVSLEFKSYRLKLANHLGALKSHPYDIKVQEDFQQGGFTLLDQLADYIRQCDLIIHLVGDACGARPTTEHVQALHRWLGDAPPRPLPGHSYTQWEYHLARRFQRKTLVYLAAHEAPRDRSLPIQQSAEAARLQQAHIAAIKASGKHYSVFAGHATLVREVFHDLGLEPELKVNNLPYKSLGSLFKGRDKFLRQIHRTLGRIEHRGHVRFAAITASATVATVHGLGGIGKTRAAIEYAHRHAEEYTALLYARADSPGALQQNLAALCGPTVLDLPKKAPREIEVKVGAVLHWLQQHPGWLLILDNADSDEAAQAVTDLLGKLTPSGQVLVTSRLSNWPGAVESLPLDVLAVADATAFLLERTDHRRRKAPDDSAQARTVALQLGQLALALEQAGAYIAHHRYTFSQYLAEWYERRDKVLAWYDELAMQYPMSVAVTWKTSFDSLTEAARRLLRILAWLAADPVPEWLLESGGGPFASLDRGASADARAALADLDAHSLVTRANEAPAFSVHRLVQEVTRRSLEGANRTDLKAALRWVDDAFVGNPQDVRTWPTLAPLAPHALAVYDEVWQLDPSAENGDKYARALLAQKRFPEAERVFRDVLGKLHELGEENPEAYVTQLAAILNNLGLVYYRTRQFTKAVSCYREVFDIYSKHTEHKTYLQATATNFTNLGNVLLDSDKLAEAEESYKLSLDIWRNLARHNFDYVPNVALTLNNLAGIYFATKNFGQAQRAYQAALETWRQVVKHKRSARPDVARTLNGLGALYGKMGKFHEAEASHQEALSIRRQLAKENPEAYFSDVAESLNNLGMLYRETNMLVQSERAHEEALGIYRRLNTDTPTACLSELATTLNDLALVYGLAQSFTQAENLFQEALGILHQLAKDNPDVYLRQLAESLNHLGLMYRNCGRLPEAVAPHEEELAINRRLAKNNPAVHLPILAATLSNLGIAYTAIKKLAEAKRAHKEALEIGRQVANIDPSTYLPIVATSLNNLAFLYQAERHLKQAQECADEAVKIWRRLRRASPATYSDYLGRALLTQAQIRKQRKSRRADVVVLAKEVLKIASAESLKQEARALCKIPASPKRLSTSSIQGLTIEEKALGPDDADVAQTHYNLAELYRVEGRNSEAEQLYKHALRTVKRVSGPNHLNVGRILNGLGQLYTHEQKYGKAEILLERALAINKTALGPDHPEVGRIINNLAVLYRSQERFAEAEPLYKEALAISKKALGENSPDVAIALNNLGVVYKHEGRFAEAETLYRQALSIDEATLGPDDPIVGVIASNLATTLHKLGRDAEARNYEQQAERIRTKQPQ